MNSNNVCIPINAGGTLAVGTTYVYGFHVPDAGNGGGITVTDVKFSSNAAIAAASAPNFTLVTSGTDSVVDGSVTSATGSAAFTAGTPRQGTISSGFVDADSYVFVKWAQTAANANMPVLTCSVQYVMGK